MDAPGLTSADASWQISLSPASGQGDHVKCRRLIILVSLAIPDIALFMDQAGFLLILRCSSIGLDLRKRRLDVVSNSILKAIK